MFGYSVFRAVTRFNLRPHELKCPHGKRQLVSTCSKISIDIRSSYGSLLAGLEGESGDFIYPVDTFYGSARHATTIVQHEIEVFSK